jgi:hypothetical protein
LPITVKVNILKYFIDELAFSILLRIVASESVSELLSIQFTIVVGVKGLEDGCEMVSVLLGNQLTAHVGVSGLFQCNISLEKRNIF